MVESWFAEQQIDIALCYNVELSKHAASSLALMNENLYLYISPRPKTQVTVSFRCLAQFPLKRCKTMNYLCLTEETRCLSCLKSKPKSLG
ncbi:hypothetical protein P4S73_05480 [Paraglaciecola sp. Hal342]